MIPDDLRDHPPSDKLVYVVLENDLDEGTISEIATRAQLPESTTFNAIYRLRDEDIVDFRHDLDDPSTKRWFVY